MCMGVCKYMPHECKGLLGTGKGMRSLETGITGNLELLNTGARN